jgi:hypothetical protein
LNFFFSLAILGACAKPLPGIKNAILRQKIALHGMFERAFVDQSRPLWISAETILMQWAI